MKKEYCLNRKQYERVRKMDHIQMSLWVDAVYQSGYSEGVKAAGGLTNKELIEVLLGISGFGQKKAMEAAMAIESAMTEKQKTK